MGRLEREELRVVLLDTKNHVLRVSTVYLGNVSASLVRVGELYRDAVRLDAAGIILVHNHPSGDPTPSPDDLHLTAEALAAGRLLDIALLDHLVIGHDAFVSLRDRGIAFDRPAGFRPRRSRAADDDPAPRIRRSGSALVAPTLTRGVARTGSMSVDRGSGCRWGSRTDAQLYRSALLGGHRRSDEPGRRGWRAGRTGDGPASGSARCRGILPGL